MTLPRNYLLRYVVVGTKKDGSKILEHYTSGREAYVMESFHKRNGATGVRIIIKSS